MNWATRSTDRLWPILLKNSISTDGRKILASRRHEACVDLGGTQRTVGVASDGLLAGPQARDRWHFRLQSHQSEIRRLWDFEFFNRIGRSEKLGNVRTWT